jgi:hypothetical protein
LRAALKLLFIAVSLSPLAIAQSTPSGVLTKGTWEVGVWAGGGTGLGARSHTQFFNSGFRFGRVLTDEMGSGWYRGNLAFAVDLIPVYYVFQEKSIYGAGFNPVLLKWNFTSGRTVAVFAEGGGGLQGELHAPGRVGVSRFYPRPPSRDLHRAAGAHLQRRAYRP